MPLVSIILPTYNVEQFIAEALESCVQQSFRDIEIIVVDDCGSDNSIAIAKEYATKDSRIRIVHNKENFQLFAARAEGVKVAQGEYIMFLDPDDFLESNALQTCVDSMPQLRGGVDLVCFDYKTLQDSRTHHIEYYRDAIYTNINDFYLFCLKKSWINWNIWSKLFKRDLYLKAFDLINPHIRIGVAEDCLLYAAYSNLIHNVITIQAPLITYRIHTQSMSATNTTTKIVQHIQDHRFIYTHIQEYFRSMATSDISFAQKMFCKRYLELIAQQIASLQLEYKKHNGTFSKRDSRIFSYNKQKARYKRYLQNTILKIWKILFNTKH